MCQLLFSIDNTDNIVNSITDTRYITNDCQTKSPKDRISRTESPKQSRRLCPVSASMIIICIATNVINWRVTLVLMFYCEYILQFGIFKI